MKICVFRYIRFASKSCGFEGRHVLSQREKRPGTDLVPGLFAGLWPVDGAKKSCCFRHTEKQEIRRHPRSRWTPGVPGV
ncbi:hypothetical protein HMPREF0239_02485 [Clostridium sp. ATCC BAA-442]|nr:hypothetical protein HMPREF0239_02485 [Clostridium sp. ATCC BAA-442]